MPRSSAVVGCIAALAGLLGLSGCAPNEIGTASRPSDGNGQRSVDCRAAASLGRFEPAVDLLIANFDNKPDTDDLVAMG
jgi:hypothetical protein